MMLLLSSMSRQLELVAYSSLLDLVRSAPYSRWCIPMNEDVVTKVTDALGNGWLGMDEKVG